MNLPAAVDENQAPGERNHGWARIDTDERSKKISARRVQTHRAFELRQKKESFLLSSLIPVHPYESAVPPCLAGVTGGAEATRRGPIPGDGLGDTCVFPRRILEPLSCSTCSGRCRSVRHSRRSRRDVDAVAGCPSRGLSDSGLRLEWRPQD